MESPDRNFKLIDTKDIADILAKPFPNTSITLGTFFEKYAFYEIYNMNGKGARTHQDAKDFLSYFYPLHPIPLQHE